MRRPSAPTVLLLSVLVLSACATTSGIPPRSEFTDVPVPEGFAYQADRSAVIESPAVKAARLVYRGRTEPDSLAASIRTTLEANGWRQLSGTSVPRQGSIQVYEKSGDALQVRIWEGGWFDYYTYVEYAASRVARRTTAATH